MRRGHLPAPGGWRRKAVAGLTLLIFAPVLLAAGLVAAGQVVQIIDHVIGLVWPWVAAVVVLVSVWRLIIGRR
jgi:hypothetical protein